MTTETVPLIDIRNATLWRGSTRVFDGLDLEIGQRERVAIIGPNGSGKTTLLKAINREIYPVARPGTWVRVLGRSDWNVWQLRRQIGILSHDLQAAYPKDVTALEVAVSGFHSSIGVHGSIAGSVTASQTKRARAVLESLDMGSMLGTRLGELSTGQQRRCLLARALVHSPATLILDEPTAGLDFAASFDFLRRLRKLGDTNLILVTHHLNDIPPDIDRVVVLKRGRIVADGSKASVLKDALLSDVYETPIRVIRADGHFLACPG